MLAGYQVLAEVRGPRSEEGRAVTRHLAQLYDAMGNPDEAKKYRSKT